MCSLASGAFSQRGNRAPCFRVVCVILTETLRVQRVPVGGSHGWEGRSFLRFNNSNWLWTMVTLTGIQS